MRRELLFLAFLISCSSTETTSVGAGVGTGGGSSGGGAAVSRTSAASVELDPQERQALEQSSPRTLQRMNRGEPLTVNDVIKLSQAGVQDETTLSYLRQSHTSYQLTSAQIRRLHDAGVSDTLIDEMVNSGQLVP